MGWGWLKPMPLFSRCQLLISEHSVMLENRPSWQSLLQFQFGINSCFLSGKPELASPSGPRFLTPCTLFVRPHPFKDASRVEEAEHDAQSQPHQGLSRKADPWRCSRIRLVASSLLPRDSRTTRHPTADFFEIGSGFWRSDLPADSTSCNFPNRIGIDPTPRPYPFEARCFT